jgi:hypothetical protein
MTAPDAGTNAGSSNAGSPWADFPVAPPLTACAPIYALLMAALHVISRDPEVPTLAAVVALTELLGDLIASSGALWVAPDIIPALRDNATASFPRCVRLGPCERPEARQRPP